MRRAPRGLAGAGCRGGRHHCVLPALRVVTRPRPPCRRSRALSTRNACGRCARMWLRATCTVAYTPEKPLQLSHRAGARGGMGPRCAGPPPVTCRRSWPAAGPPPVTVPGTIRCTVGRRDPLIPRGHGACLGPTGVRKAEAVLAHVQCAAGSESKADEARRARCSEFLFVFSSRPPLRRARRGSALRVKTLIRIDFRKRAALSTPHHCRRSRRDRARENNYFCPSVPFLPPRGHAPPRTSPGPAARLPGARGAGGP